MKALLKTLIVAALAAVIAFSATGCSDKDNPIISENSSLDGKWANEKTIFYNEQEDIVYEIEDLELEVTFNSDGSGAFEVNNDSYEFTWEANGSKLTICYKGDCTTATFEINGSDLEIVYTEGYDYHEYYTRIE